MSSIFQRRQQSPLPPISMPQNSSHITRYSPFVYRDGQFGSYSSSGDNSTLSSASVMPVSTERRRRRTAELLEVSAHLINLSLQALMPQPNVNYPLVVRSGRQPVHRIRVDYVTDRLITMLFPADNEDEDYALSLKDVSLNLRNKFGEYYKILNLSQRRLDLCDYNDHVIEYGWPEELAPPIRFLRAMCHEVRSWLAASERNVIVLHCKGGPGRLATLIAAYMYYCMTRGRIDRSVLADQGALKQYYEERLNTTCLPSQRRYVQYFASLLSGSMTLSETTVELHSVCLLGLPRLESSDGAGRLQLKIYQNMRLRRVTPTLKLVNQNLERLIIEIEPPLALCGDILIKCFYRKNRECPRETIFRLQFHTCSIHHDQASFYKQELDAACIDFRYPANGRVELNFRKNDSLHEESAKALLVGHVAFEKTGEPPTFVHCDSYEDLCLPILPPTSSCSFSTDIDSGGQMHGPMDQRQSTRLSAVSHTGGPIDGQLHINTRTSDTEEIQRKMIVANESQPNQVAAGTMLASHDANELDRLLEELKVVGDASSTSHRSVGSSQPNYQYSTTLTRSYNGPSGSVSVPRHSTSSQQEQVLIDELRSAQDRLLSLRRAQSTEGTARDPGWEEHHTRRNVVDANGGAEHEAFDISLRYTSLPAASRQRQQHSTTTTTAMRERSPGGWVEHDIGSRYRSASTDRYIAPGPSHSASTNQWSYSSPGLRGAQPRSMSVEANRFPVEHVDHSTTRQTYRSQSQEHFEHGGPVSPMGRHYAYPHTEMETVEVHRDEPLMNTYSAHRENLRLQQQMQQAQPTPSQGHSSGQQFQRTVQRQTYQQASRVAEPAEVVEEVETVTLQPIGKGVQDLEPARPTTPGVPSAPIGSRTPTMGRAADMSLLGQHQQMQHTTQRTTYQHSAQVHHGGQMDNFGRGRSPMRQHSGYEYHQEMHGGMAPGLGHSRTNSGSSMEAYGIGIAMDGTVGGQSAPRFVKDTSCFWYKPTISRDEAISILREKSPGTFVVRDSNSYPGAYGLAVKVAQLPPGVTPKSDDLQSELVRHFLIEPTSKGVRLKGCPNEPVFGSLAALVYQHTLTPLALPCRLTIPEQDLFSGPSGGGHMSVDGPSSPADIMRQGAACNVLYMGSVDVESLTGSNAVGRAVDIVINQMNAGRQTTDVQFKASSDGITLTDNLRKLFFRRHYQLNLISYCGLDPKDRVWDSPELRSRGIQDSRIFAFVSRRQGSASENVCHVFSEVEATQPAAAIVKFVNKYLLGQTMPANQ